MLAISDKNGEVQGSVPGLARLAGVSVDLCRAAIGKFLGPDPDSRTKDDEGRRIEEIGGGWHLLNHAKYRAMASEEEERIKNAERQARHRIRQKRNGGVTDSNAAVTHSNGAVTPSNDIQKQIQTQKADADADADSKADSQAVPPKRPTRSASVGYAVPPCFENVDGFTAALGNWIENRRALRKPATPRAIQLMIDRLAERPTEAVKALEKCVMSGWQGFEWSWIDKDKPKSAISTIPGEHEDILKGVEIYEC